MRPRVLISTIAILFAVTAVPFTNQTHACTEPDPTPVPVWVTRISPTQVSISVQGLTKSASPAGAANGCACAFKNLGPILSIDRLVVEDANGDLLPATQWPWIFASPTADAAWAARPGSGGGSWTSFKAENCGCLETGTKFGFRFLARPRKCTVGGIALSIDHRKLSHQFAKSAIRQAGFGSPRLNVRFHPKRTF